MPTLIIGANGAVGSKLVRKLTEAGEDITAGVGREEQVQSLKDEGIDAKLIDVEKDSIQTLTDKFQSYNKVVFSVGSGGSTGADKTIIVDLDGAVKAIKASKENNVDQFVMVSTYDSRREAFDASEGLKPYTIAKHYADEYLKQSGVPYAIVHPGALLDDEGTGKIEVGAFFSDRGSIPREDVATVLKEVVTGSNDKNVEFQIVQGDTEIKQALSDNDIL